LLHIGYRKEQAHADLCTVKLKTFAHFWHFCRSCCSLLIMARLHWRRRRQNVTSMPMWTRL